MRPRTVLRLKKTVFSPTAILPETREPTDPHKSRCKNCDLTQGPRLLNFTLIPFISNLLHSEITAMKGDRVPSIKKVILSWVQVA